MKNNWNSGMLLVQYKMLKPPWKLIMSYKVSHTPILWLINSTLWYLPPPPPKKTQKTSTYTKKLFYVGFIHNPKLKSPNAYKQKNA